MHVHHRTGAQDTVMCCADIIASWIKFIFSGSEKLLRKNFCQKLPAAYPVCTYFFLFMSRPLGNGPISHSQCGQIKWRETVGSWLSQQRGQSETMAAGMTRRVFWECPIVMPIFSSYIALYPHSVCLLMKLETFEVTSSTTYQVCWERTGKDEETIGIDCLAQNFFHWKKTNLYFL